MNPHFVTIPSKLLRDPELPPRAVSVYAFLAMSSDSSQVRTSSSLISEGLGMAKGTVQLALLDLERGGYITREVLRHEGRRYAGMVYTLVDHTEVRN